MTQKIIIVDANDQVIGYKERTEVTYDDTYRVAGLWVLNEAGDALLARRALTKKHDPGKWGPSAAGTVEEGETYESNMAKEAEEELGLTGFPLRMLHTELLQQNHKFFCTWFYVSVPTDTQFRIQP